MNSKELRIILDSPSSWERDQKIKEWQNKFILKSGISRRLFDQMFKRCTNRKPQSERRLDIMDKKS